MAKDASCLALIDLIEKCSALRPEVIPQEHQHRVANKITGESPKLLVYHGLGTGKSLASILSAEKAKEETGDDYGVVLPASLRQNFAKELSNFTTDSNPEILSYTNIGSGKGFEKQPKTLIVDEAHRLRNPQSQASKALAGHAALAKRLILLSGSPIVNEPSDLAAPLSLLTDKVITPESFEKEFVGSRKVSPGFFASLRGVKPGEEQFVNNEQKLRKLLKGKVDYQPGKAPEGVNIQEEEVTAPLTPSQQRIQEAIRKKIPTNFLWKLDKEFPLSKSEVSKLTAFLSGLRQVSLSTKPFRADADDIKSFEQSGKLQKAMENLKELVAKDPRKKALIYSNFVDAGINPYAAALKREGIPYGIFHGGISPKERKKAIDEYNAGKLKALLIGPAGAEGISTKGTNLIQLLDPHWNEARSSQASGRGLRFDSHLGLPEDLKDVKIQRYISKEEAPGIIGRLLGKSKHKTGDEILQLLAKNKETLNEKFRQILREEGSKHE